ncbi:hypothetical protein HII31_00224 [Pseudocercospora fuligena]|uniref:Uncharacterized protein n=1 Tax=Pseudocercospora fuligena TaxID=685502 RepID=A0A8H6VTR3_9PEZI|nr:hypothetical protein HII31_00224 [Pseudocercospora fuligena]
MKSIAALAALVATSAAQNMTMSNSAVTYVPRTCTGNYTQGRDEVYYTVPYTYDQVMSIIGNYSNLTWSGSPENSVSLNGTDNTVGTARTYDIAGAHVIETILEYSKPPSPGPYNEVHNTALLNVPSAGNVSFYIPFDGTVVSSVCDGKASAFNFTAVYCATNASVAGEVLHMLHLGDAVTVGKFLGGKNFTSCEALGSNATGPMNQTASFPSAANATANGTTGEGATVTTSGGGASTSSSAADVRYGGGLVGGAMLVIAGLMVL